MGHRLSRIYTRTGDSGETGLGNGERVFKNSLRVQAMGDVDELNAALGLLMCEQLPEELRTLLSGVQHELFDLGGELCIPDSSMIRAQQVERLEAELDRLNAPLAPLKEFILPGGSRAAALAHLARTICRRAERTLVALSQSEGETVNVAPRHYLNRLSDLLFVLARVLNHAAGQPDVLWQKARQS